MTIRELIQTNKAIRKLHDKWSNENGQILEQDKDKWNFGIIVRNHTRNFIDELLKIIL